MSDEAAAGDSTVLSLTSRSSIRVTLSSVFPHGRFNVFPYVEERGLLYLQLRGGSLAITAGKYVGLIPLSDNVSVNVQPKLPVSNLAHVLDTANARIDYLEADRIYRSEGLAGTTILAFLLENLLEALQPIRCEGYLKQYIAQDMTGCTPRGRVSVGATIQKCFSRGQEYKLAYSLASHSIDVPENRVLKAALAACIRSLRKLGGHSTLLRRAGMSISDMPSSIGALQVPDLRYARSWIETPGPVISKSYYTRALSVACLILSGKGLALQASGSDVSLASMIIDFEAVFEQYTRRVLQEDCPGHVYVRNGNTEGKRPLFDDKRDPPAQPDIVIVERKSRKCVVVEVKYKDKPSREDINQVVTYALAYRTRQVVLAHQRKPAGRSGLYKIGIISGISVSGYAFDLERDDLPVEENSFRQAIYALLEDA